VLALGALLAGCGAKTTVQGGNDTFSATTLTVYSNLPLLGRDGAAMQSMVNGEALALYDAGGRVYYGSGRRRGEFHISIDSQNDGDPAVGGWTDESTQATAKIASQDLSAVAYIGDFDNGATARSLPLNNENDVLQISPGSPYLGFTDGGPGVPSTEPTFFYPFGLSNRTFARLVPSDVGAARATLRFMRTLGVRRVYLLTDGADQLDAEIVPLVAAGARAAGIAIAGRGVVAGGDPQTPAATSPAAFATVARAVAAAHPDAVLYGGAANLSAPALWQELHTLVGAAKLFAPSTLALPVFLTALGAAAPATYVTSPYLELGQYPAAAQPVLREYRRVFGLAPTVYTLYGYDAMRIVLAAIHRAGRQAPKRTALSSAFFHLGQIRGVLGDYRISATGDTSLDRFDGYRVGAGGALVLVREIS